MQSSHNKKLVDFREKLARLQSPPKKQSHHSFIKQLHKRNKLIQKDIEIILDNISEHYFQSEENIVRSTREAINYIQSKENQLLQTLDDFKQKQLDLIKDDIENFLKAARKVKKIIANQSLQKMYSLEKYESMCGKDEIVKVIVNKLNKLKPESQRINQLMSEYFIALKSLDLDFVPSIEEDIESQNINLKMMMKEHENKKSKKMKKCPKQGTYKKCQDSSVSRHNDKRFHKKQYVEQCISSDTNYNIGNLDELLLAANTPQKSQHNNLLSSKVEQLIRLVHKNQTIEHTELQQKKQSQTKNSYLKETGSEKQQENQCSIIHRMNSYGSVNHDENRGSQQTTPKKSKDQKIVFSQNISNEQSEGIDIDEKQTNLMQEVDINGNSNNYENKYKNRSWQQKRKIDKTSLTILSNKIQKPPKQVEFKRPKIPTTKHKKVAEPIENKKELTAGNRNEEDKNQFKEQFKLELDCMKSEIMGKYSGHQTNEEMKAKIERKLGKVRSHENLRQLASNEYNQQTIANRSPRYQIQRNPETNEKTDELISIRSAQRLQNLRSNRGSVGNTSRTTSKGKNWMKILQDQQTKYNEMKAKRVKQVETIHSWQYLPKKQ